MAGPKHRTSTQIGRPDPEQDRAEHDDAAADDRPDPFAQTRLADEAPRPATDPLGAGAPPSSSPGAASPQVAVGSAAAIPDTRSRPRLTPGAARRPEAGAAGTAGDPAAPTLGPIPRTAAHDEDPEMMATLPRGPSGAPQAARPGPGSRTLPLVVLLIAAVVLAAAVAGCAVGGVLAWLRLS
ncbi:MAG: hypothetical protein ACFCGT_18950 [Sandaracinaceae bacterium]